MYFAIILTIHLILCALLVCLVLLQQGKGAELGATLSGASNTVFGAAGAVPFIARLTTGVAVAFMLTSLLLVRAYNSGATGSIASPSESSGLTAGSVVVDDSVVAPAAPSEKKVEDALQPQDQVEGSGGGPAAGDGSQGAGEAAAVSAPESVAAGEAVVVPSAPQEAVAKDGKGAPGEAGAPQGAKKASKSSK